MSVSQGLLGGHRQQTPLGGAARDDPHRGRVDLAEPDARAHDRERRIRRLAHGLVHEALRLAEGAVDRERAGDVGGVVAVDLDARVQKDQVARHDRAVVARPVQDARVRPARRDRVVAHGVPVGARPPVEHALDEPFAARVGGDAIQVADHVVEPARRGVDGCTELGHLVGVLDEAQLGEIARELVVVVVVLGARVVAGLDEAEGVDLVGECRIRLTQDDGAGVGRRR